MKALVAEVNWRLGFADHCYYDNLKPLNIKIYREFLK
jgi:hypothetical protein